MVDGDSRRATRAELEQRIRELEARVNETAVPYRAIYEHIHHEVHVWEVVRDEEGRIRTWRLIGANPPALRSWGRTLEEVVGKTPDEMFPGSRATELFMPIVEKIFATGEPHHWEQRFDHTGQILDMVSIPVGERFISTGTDSTERRRREARLEQTLSRLHEASRAGRVGLWELDLATQSVFYSDEWKAQLGWGSDDVSADLDDWLQCVHPDDRPELERRLEACMAGHVVECEATYRLTHRDGSERWFLCHGAMVADAGGEPKRLLGSQIDITERRRLESQARSSEQLRAIGMLAAGIAHDFNNLLMAILGNVSLAKELAGPASEAAEVLGETEAVFEEARALTSQLMTFSESGAPVRELTSLSELVAQSARFVSRGSRSRCRVEISPDLADAEVDAGQISQVVSNLVINALEAMPDGAEVRVSGANVTVGDEGPTGLAAGSYVRLSVSDDGPGIPDTLRERVFEPYFTTKDAGHGLGLAICHSIVDAHRGTLRIDEDGPGTTVHVYLPASADRAQRAESVPAAPSGGTVLVMDDDPLIRRVYKRMLGRLGYRVTCCADGRDAIELYEQSLEDGSAYDVVVLDLTVPGGMGGEETLSALRALDPTVPALVASGDRSSELRGHYEDDPAVAFVQKPFTMATLAERLAVVT